MVGATPLYLIYQSGHIFQNIANIAMSGWKKIVLTHIVLAESDTKFIGQTFTITVIVVGGTKLSALLVTTILE